VTEARSEARAQARAGSGPLAAMLNQGDQGEDLIPPSLILIPDIPDHDIPDIPASDIGVPWVPSGA
jgi:hypothetical protein